MRLAWTNAGLKMFDTSIIIKLFLQVSLVRLLKGDGNLPTEMEHLNLFTRQMKLAFSQKPTIFRYMERIPMRLKRPKHNFTVFIKRPKLVLPMALNQKLSICQTLLRSRRPKHNFTTSMKRLKLGSRMLLRQLKKNPQWKIAALQK